MITILIATKNRSDFLIRSLNYYKSVKFRGPIHIGDSSEPVHMECAKKVIRSLAGEMNVVHYEYPSLDIAECHKKLIQSVSTKYIANVADAGFLVPDSLGRCVEFLESRLDYVAAHERAIMISLRSPGAYGQVESAGPLLHRSIEGDTAADRLIYHLSNYSEILYSVYRADTWRLMWENAHFLTDRRLGGELLPACLATILGKVKELDRLSLVRHIHDRRYLLPDPYDWITGTNWPPSYQIFRDCLAADLARRDGLSVEEAREIVKRAFWSYLAPGLMRTWQARYAQNGRGLPSRWRELAKRVPGLRNAWHMILSSLPRRDDEMSLERLLNPSSPYHGDFMPVYRAITTSPRD